jgi:flagellar biosynthetic protein FliR
MEFLAFLTDSNVLTFFLLFIRFSAIFAFFPFFSHSLIPMSLKSSLIFYLTLLFFPTLPEYLYENITPVSIIIMVLSELMVGFMASITLSIVFGLLHFAGEQISFIMGFQMASTIDPASGTNSTVMGQTLTLIAILLTLSFDAHHMIILYVQRAIESVPLGTLVFNQNIVEYLMKSMGVFFMIGFSIAFPVVSIGLLSDLIFGMMMKTMPQFNLLTVGIPIKTGVSLLVLTFVIGGMMFVFKHEFLNSFNALELFLAR